MLFREIMTAYLENYIKLKNSQCMENTESYTVLRNRNLSPRKSVFTARYELYLSV